MGILSQDPVTSQAIYFNTTIDLAGDWGIGMSVLADDSAYYIAAITGPGAKITIIKLGISGNQEAWIKRYGNPDEGWYPGSPGSFKKNNNDYIIAGGVDGGDTVKGIFIKFNHLGDSIMTKRYINADDDYLNLTNGNLCRDAGFIFTGDISRIVGPPDMLLLKTDSLGNELWRTTKNLGGYERGWSIIQTPDSGFVVGGYTYIPGLDNSGNPIIVKFDKNGNYKWDINPGGPLADEEAMVCLDDDSTFMVLTAIADSTYIPDMGYTRINVIKYTQNGIELWNRKYGNSIPGNFISNIKSLPDGGYICCGGQKIIDTAHRAGWLLRLNTDGDSIWFRRYMYYTTGYPYNNNYLYDVSQTVDGGFIATGEVFNAPPNSLQKVWVLKVDSIGCDTAGCDPTVGIEEEDKTIGLYDGRKGGLEVWPNPAGEQIHCRLSIFDCQFSKYYELLIYDIFGRRVEEVLVPVGQVEMRLDVSGYPSGLYFAVVRNKTGVIGSAKFLVAH